MESRVIPPAQASARQTEMGEKFNRVLFAALDALQDRNIPYAMIGGIAASGMGRPRSTHDIDIFVRPEDAEAALEALGAKGFDIERTDPRWLFKGWKDEMMVDIIFKSSPDIYFDNEMQNRARMIHYHGRDIPAVSPEDLIIIKAAVHAEVGPHHWHDALAILSHAQVDWAYLQKRARRAMRRVLALLIYAQSNDIWIPNSVIQELFQGVFGQQQGGQAQSASARPATSAAGLASAAIPQTNAAASAERRSVQPVQTHMKEQPVAYLAGHLLEALANDDRTASLDVQLFFNGRTIIVKGEAPSVDCKRAIESVIRDQAKDYEVDNQVRVTEVSAPATEEVV